jgi:Acyl-CoA oxidase
VVVFWERIQTVDDANVKQVLSQLMQLYGTYRLTIDAADFVEVSVFLNVLVSTQLAASCNLVSVYGNQCMKFIVLFGSVICHFIVLSGDELFDTATVTRMGNMR